MGYRNGGGFDIDTGSLEFFDEDVRA